MIEWIVKESGLSSGGRVLDVGCGTGIATRLFAERGMVVLGIDPNETMLEKARLSGLGRFARGEATATGAPDAAFDLVTVGQAFHWFETEPTLREFRRVLKPDGSCAVFWNVRASTPFLDAYDALLRKESTEYSGVRKPGEARASLGASTLVRERVEGVFPNSQLFDREGLLGRARSSSYVAHGVRDMDAFDRALGALFEAHQTGGRVEFAYEAKALVFKLQPVSATTRTPPQEGSGRDGG
jgi:SAM-dependent methyltransferase